MHNYLPKKQRQQRIKFYDGDDEHIFVMERGANADYALGAGQLD